MIGPVETMSGTMAEKMDGIGVHQKLVTITKPTTKPITNKPLPPPKTPTTTPQATPTKTPTETLTTTDTTPPSKKPTRTWPASLEGTGTTFQNLLHLFKRQPLPRPLVQTRILATTKRGTRSPKTLFT